MTFDEWIADAIFTQQFRTKEEWMRIAFEAATSIEREECAKACEAIQAKTDKWGPMAGYCAEQIRMRSNVEGNALGAALRSPNE